jgi:4-diphosphocytidyl-2-C-methyl-D-erythritol kinase
VLKPPQGLSTADIFNAPDLQRSSEPAIISGFAADPYGFGRNDLQPVAQRLCPQVALGIDLLAHIGLKGRMTGSGSAVFARAPDAAAADAARALAPPDWQVRLCSSLDAHPLCGWASGSD